MFSGIVKGIGTALSVQNNKNGIRVAFNTSLVKPKMELKLGDSVAVNGVCLTVIDFTNNSFEAEISNTTLELTNLQGLVVGSKVNLEPALRLNEAVNGHLVTGHIDATCCLKEVVESGFSRVLSFAVPESLSKYIVERGSVTLDGISLTVNSISSMVFKVTIIPHTWENTIANQWHIEEKINLEIDMMARYLERLNNQT
jgi:riboflavin synthase